MKRGLVYGLKADTGFFFRFLTTAAPLDAVSLLLVKLSFTCAFRSHDVLALFHTHAGKSTLLKMIANNLHKSSEHVVGGQVSICGIQPGEGVVWTNLAGYIDQIDRLHPFLTVFETCEFAWQCRSGGTHRKPMFGEGPEVDETIAMMDESLLAVNKILDGLGLARVKDTFVGDQTRVRGVSGGEKVRTQDDGYWNVTGSNSSHRMFFCANFRNASRSLKCSLPVFRSCVATKSVQVLMVRNIFRESRFFSYDPE